jgi:hypothetical protein
MLIGLHMEVLMHIVKILVITDDEGGFQRANNKYFHIGEFVQVLADTVWDGFTIEIVKAHRKSAATGSDAHADIYDFRFSDTSLAGFDMAFFFSIFTPAEDSSFCGTTDTSRKEEAAAIARFMEAGKGYFAAGDHEDLGGGVNMHVPRVRSMRRWVFGGANPRALPIAPSGTGADRHDTLRAGSDTGILGGTSYPYQFNDQSDALPQQIGVKRYVTGTSRYFQTTLPHQLLCCPLGTVNVLPDHMHEGWCEQPGNLGLDEDLPGRSGKKEYPPLGGSSFGPEIIAWGTVEPHATYNQEFAGSIYEVSPLTTTSAPFGQIAAYDGHRVGIGRAVCQSTWHHFVNINVIGTNRTYPGMNPAKAKGFYAGPGDTAVPEYEKIKYYYRNLVYWLIPADRTYFIWDFAVAGLRRHPKWEEFKGHLYLERLTLDYIFALAQLSDHYFSTARGHCYAWQFIGELYYPIWKLDLHIWERWIIEIDPWSPEAINFHARKESRETWPSMLAPAPQLARHFLLGTIMVAALRQQAEQQARLAKGKKIDHKSARKELLGNVQSLLADHIGAFADAFGGAAKELKGIAAHIDILAGARSAKK